MKRFLTYTIFIFFIFSVLQSSYVLYRIDTLQITKEYYKPTAQASGTVGMCVNTPPTVTLPCNTTANQGERYTCTANVTDESTNLFYNTTFITNQTLFRFNSSGVANFTPEQDEIGNHTFNLSVTDTSSCKNNKTVTNFTLEVINENDPPKLVETIPDVNLDENEIVKPFFLNNHFTDPDGDNMTFNVTDVDEATIRINQNTSEVTVTSETCGYSDVVSFTATDPFNATGVSNSVTIQCQEQQQRGQQGGKGGGGGGAAGGGAGGGGGGLCQPNFVCQEYIPCRKNGTKVKRCVDKNGCKDPEYLTVSCKYKPQPKCTENWQCDSWGQCYMNNTQYRQCVDVNNCGTTKHKPPEQRSCQYEPTCNDKVRNGNETGIDCGGPCAPCQTVETPTPVEEQEEAFLTWLYGVVLALLVGVVVFRWKRKVIYKALARTGLRFAGRVPKQLLLSEDDRDRLLDMVENARRSMEYEDYFDVVREFYRRSLDVAVESGEGALRQAADSCNEQLTQILVSLYNKAVRVEFDQTISDARLLVFIEELAEVIVEVSPEDPSVLRARQYESDEAYVLENFMYRLADAYVALHYNQVGAAKDRYFGLLQDYNALTPSQQQRVYEELNDLYTKIKYRSSWLRNL